MIVWHGTRSSRAPRVFTKSKDKAVIAWFSTSRAYAEQYGTPYKYEINFENALDIRKHTKPGRYRCAEKTVSKWVNLFVSVAGLDVSIIDESVSEVECQLWDLTYGGDMDLTRSTTLPSALRESDYDVIIVYELGTDRKRYVAYGLLKPRYALV